MKILILTQWYPPEPAALMHDMAKVLVANGHQVQVLTGFPNYPSGQIYPGYRLKIWQREWFETVDVLRVWLYPDHSQSGIKRALNYVSFAMSAMLLGPVLRHRPDVIFTYHPPLTAALPAMWLSLVWQRPFVYQVQDLWPETLAATGMIQHSLPLRIIGQLAKFVYKAAAKIVVISDGFKQNLVAKGVPDTKVQVVSNWVDPSAYYPTEKDDGLALELGLKGKFNLMFAGNVGEAQGLDMVVDAAELLSDQPHIQIVIVGDGVALPRLQKLARQKNLQNIRFLGRYKSEEMPALYALADVLFLHLRDEPLFRITIPHKIFAYMASEKPILAAVAGDAAVLIEKSAAGVVTHPGDAVGFAEKARMLAEMPPGELRQWGCNGRSHVIERYNKDYLVGKLMALMKVTVN